MRMGASVGGVPTLAAGMALGFDMGGFERGGRLPHHIGRDIGGHRRFMLPPCRETCPMPPPLRAEAAVRLAAVNDIVARVESPRAGRKHKWPSQRGWAI
jgi:hypothetical protein